MSTTIDALQIKPNLFLVKRHFVTGFDAKFSVNGSEVLAHKKDSITVKPGELECTYKRGILESYARGSEHMSIEDYKSKPQRHWEDSSDEEIIDAIANKKALSGFKPVYKSPQIEEVLFNVVGYISDTNSSFITCNSNADEYSKNQVVYDVDGSLIAMDQYKLLSEKYKDQASFEVPSRKYLRFTSINYNFAFDDVFPFRDCSYYASFTTLVLATEYEDKIRNAVTSVVTQAVFQTDLTEPKRLCLISRLQLVASLKSVQSKNESIDALIEDLKFYWENCK